MAYEVGNGTTIRQLLGGTVKYTVPRYQRKYVWTDKHWQDLFEDLLFVYNLEAGDVKHFFSTFILEKLGNEGGIDCFSVIDGQQRISTVSAMLSAVCRLLIERGAQARHSMLVQYLSATDERGKYIKIGNENVDLLGEIIGDNIEFISANELRPLGTKAYHTYSAEQKNIYKCYMFFYDKIRKLIRSDRTESEIEKLMKFSNCLLDMQIVQIIVDKEQEGYDIFEILNARGTPLAQHELLKNYIFKYYKPIGDIDIAKQKWANIESLLTAKSQSALSNFIDHYTVHKYGKADRINTVLRVIKKANSTNNTKEILEDLYRKSRFYKWIISPVDFRDNDLFDKIEFTSNIYSILVYFDLKKQSQFRPLILSLFSRLDEYRLASETGAEDPEQAARLKREYRDYEKKVDAAMTHLLDMSIIELVIKKQQPKVFENKVHELARNIESGACEIDKIYETLKISITYDMFVSSFCVLGYSNKTELYNRDRTKTDIRQLLRMYELYRQGTDELTMDKMTIEHIMNDSENDIHSCYIGNLLPLADSIQRKIDGKPEFDKKVPFYRESSFETVKEFLNNYGDVGQWNENLIKNRSRELANTFYYNIFKLE